MNILAKQNHPKGLYLLFFMEMWERFSYYGMRSLLVLYMVEGLFFSNQKAGMVYGLYTGLVYLTPIFGGYIADRYLGQRKSIKIGALLMCLGLLLLAISERVFDFSLFVLVIANGFFKPNISSLLGLLYEKTPDKKDSAFTIFYLGINIGAFFSPLICATLALKYGYRYGFLASATGMLAGIIVFLLFEAKLLKDKGVYPVSKIQNSAKEKLTKRQIKRIQALFVLMFFVIIFWICYEQAGSSMTLFAQYSTRRELFNFLIPSSWLQSLNPLYIMFLAPLMASGWIYLKNKNIKITSIDKFLIALFLMGFAFLVMAFCGYLSLGSKVSILWLVVVYFIMTVAELCLSPIGLSMVSKLAPQKFASFFMGVWFLTSFFGNFLAGLWGGKYGQVNNFTLFFTLSILSFISAFVFWLLMPKLKKITGKI